MDFLNFCLSQLLFSLIPPKLAPFSLFFLPFEFMLDIHPPPVFVGGGALPLLLPPLFPFPLNRRFLFVFHPSCSLETSLQELIFSFRQVFFRWQIGIGGGVVVLGGGVGRRVPSSANGI